MLSADSEKLGAGFKPRPPKLDRSPVASLPVDRRTLMRVRSEKAAPNQASWGYQETVQISFKLVLDSVKFLV